MRFQLSIGFLAIAACGTPVSTELPVVAPIDPDACSASLAWSFVPGTREVTVQSITVDPTTDCTLLDFDAGTVDVCGVDLPPPPLDKVYDVVQTADQLELSDERGLAFAFGLRTRDLLDRSLEVAGIAPGCEHVSSCGRHRSVSLEVRPVPLLTRSELAVGESLDFRVDGVPMRTTLLEAFEPLACGLRVTYVSVRR